MCRSLESLLREMGENAAANLLGVIVLEWETSMDVPAFTFPFLLGQEESTN